eukprot:m.132493 g.132493  ORF g.132493 m.132493 type:complete len:349 (+) comp52388_c0_seq1:1964-3010(+)
MQGVVLALAVLVSAVAANFHFYQNISTNGGNDAEFFQASGNSYLVYANSNGNNADLFVLGTNNYWQSYAFFPCANCQGATYFEIEGDQFLVLSANGAPQSPVLIWDNSQNSFIDYQNLNITGSLKFKFTQFGDNYLLTASEAPTGQALVFARNATTKYFGFLQSISISNAQDMSFGVIGSNLYLTIANGDSNPSNVYKWNGQDFSLYQVLPDVTYAQDTYTYTIGTKTYLAVPTDQKATFIFVWSNLLLGFQLHQTIEGPYSYNAAIPFSHNGFNYLGIAAIGAAPTYEAPSTLYRWTGTQYVSFQGIDTWGSQTLEFFNLDGDLYMSTLNPVNYGSLNIQSQIFAWV